MNKTEGSNETSFYKLKFVKKKLRTTVGDARLSSLAVMTLEKDIMDSLQADDIIDKFALKKARRINLMYRK